MRAARMLTACLVLLFAAGDMRGGTEGVPRDAELRVSAHSRAIAPGEPVRITIASPVALRSAKGEFAGTDFPFVRAAGGASSPGATEIWSAWAIVALDEKAGPSPADVTALTLDGRQLVSSLNLTILSKQFPTETLKVDSKYVSPPKDVEERIVRELKLLVDVYARRTPEPPASAPFIRPVPGEPTSTFGMRRMFNGVPKSPHPGLDLRAAKGTPVKASGPGTVALAQDLYYSGLTVILDHGGGLFTIYAHLSRIDVASGDRIESGRLLGQSGATGRVTGPHLHWGGKIGDLPFDPTALLDPRLWKNQ